MKILRNIGKNLTNILLAGLIATIWLLQPHVAVSNPRVSITFGPPEAYAAGVADYSLGTNGTANNASITAALNALPSQGGLFHFKVGTYNITGNVSRAIGNVTIEGEGKGTLLTGSGQIVPGGTNWVFSYLSFNFTSSALPQNATWDRIYTIDYPNGISKDSNGVYTVLNITATTGNFTTLNAPTSFIDTLTATNGLSYYASPYGGLNMAHITLGAPQTNTVANWSTPARIVIADQNASGNTNGVSLSLGYNSLNFLDTAAKQTWFNNEFDLLSISQTGGNVSMTTAGNLYLRPPSPGKGVTIGEVIGIEITNSLNSSSLSPEGNITNLYGISIDNLTTGLNNYAIFTHSGLVSFGDTVLMNSHLIRDIGELRINNNASLYYKDTAGNNRQVLIMSTDNSVYITSDAAASLILRTDKAAGAGQSLARLTISGGVNTAVATWGNVTHTGFTLTSGSYIKWSDNATTPSAPSTVVAWLPVTLPDATTAYIPSYK